MFAVFEQVFSLTPARVLNDLGPPKFEPNSALAIVWSLVCKRPMPTEDAAGTAADKVKTVTRKRR